MTVWAWVQILAAASGLVVAALALSRSPTNPLCVPLILLALDQFVWNAGSFGGELTGDPRYALVGTIAAPLFTPGVFHFVLIFAGRRKSLGGMLIAAYVLFGAQSVVALMDSLIPGFDLPGGLPSYAAILLAPSLLLALFALWLLFGHLRASPIEAERWRTRVLIGALLTVMGLLTTDLLNDLGLPVPGVASLGSFAFNVALIHLTLGLGIVTGSRRLALGQALVLAMFVAACYLALFVTYRDSLGLLIVSMSALSLGLVAALRVAVKTLSQSREGLERYATLGRFSAQMAHDLRNPLAAAKGAAEFLVEEMRRSNQPQSQQFASLIVDQLDRLHAVIERYQKLSKLELALGPVDLNALVNRVLALQAFASKGEVAVKLELAAALPTLTGDAEILASALENLVKNAFEAMPERGSLTVATALREPAGHLCLSVRDTGPGMDPRAKEQAFTPFFTTKSTGSGMGLAFVRQVARAHGGEAFLSSQQGSGTLVELVLPPQGPRSDHG